MSVLGAFPVRLTLPVQWGEMDAFHHVNNVHYLRWFESARITYFAALGIAIELDGSPKLRPILARSTIDYRAPVTFPDTVTVEVLNQLIRENPHNMTQAIRSWMGTPKETK